MDLFPAIDLKDGQCVRLAQGDFDAVTVYDSDPLKMARNFAKAGARWLHVVDLDGAKDGQSRQLGLIKRIAAEVPIRLQTGGGIRDSNTIEQLIEAGTERIVIGSLAVKGQPVVKEWMKYFGPDRLVLAFDVKLDDAGEPEVLTHGWQSGSKQSLWSLIDAYQEDGLQTVLCTDVGRDGMLTGTNNDLYRTMRKRYPDLDILASGGVSGLEDLLNLTEIGVAGAVIGKAIYEGKLDLAGALKTVSEMEGALNAR